MTRAQPKTPVEFRRAATHTMIGNAMEEKMLAMLLACSPENGADAMRIYAALQKIERQAMAAHRAAENLAKFLEED